MTNEVVTVAGLTKAFAKTMAVDSLSFAIPRGSVVGFLGPNGAGKSTTIKMLLGLLRPSAGGSTLLGHDSQRLPASLWSKVGYVGEDSGLYRWMTVRSMMKYAASFYPNWDRAFAEDLVCRLELPKSKKIQALSKGQRGKVGLLMALAFRPELLILDDPVSGLDPIVRHEFLEQIIELLHMEGRTVLFSSHILDEVERIADHILIVNKGCLLVDRTLEDLKRRVKRVVLTFEGDAPALALPGALNVNRDGPFLSAVIPDFSEERRQSLEEYSAKQENVEDLSLQEIFVELIKGGAKV